MSKEISSYEKAKIGAISQKPILIRQKTSSDSNNLVIVVGKYIGKFDMVDSAPDCDCGVSEYDEETDEYYLEEGFYEQQVNWDVYKLLKIPDNLIVDWSPINYKAQEENKRLRDFVKRVSELDIRTIFYENQWDYLDYVEYIDPEITKEAADLIEELDNESNAL